MGQMMNESTADAVSVAVAEIIGDGVEAWANDWYATGGNRESAFEAFIEGVMEGAERKLRISDGRVKCHVADIAGESFMEMLRAAGVDAWRYRDAVDAFHNGFDGCVLSAYSVMPEVRVKARV